MISPVTFQTGIPAKLDKSTLSCAVAIKAKSYLPIIGFEVSLFQFFTKLSCQSTLAPLLLNCKINFPTGVSVNEPNIILSLINEMEKYGVNPEIECFDSGMVNYTNYLISKNILKGPHYINVILGNIYNSQSDIQSIASIKSLLPKNSKVCFGGIGSQQLRSNVYGLLEADGVRIGLEDNLYYKDKERATNTQLLKRVHNIMNGMELEILTSTELRNLGYGNKNINIR